MKTFLGNGVLTWNREERQSDRYGAIYLMQDGNDSLSSEPVENRIDDVNAASCEGMEGQIVATVIDARTSTHIGDLFRGIGPSKPNVGEKITLGSGVFFIEPAKYFEGVQVGVMPDDGRDNDWLDPTNLYRAHEQLVELNFIVSRTD